MDYWRHLDVSHVLSHACLRLVELIDIHMTTVFKYRPPTIQVCFATGRGHALRKWHMVPLTGPNKPRTFTVRWT